MKKMQNNCRKNSTDDCQLCIIISERVRKGFSLNNLNENDYEIEMDSC